MQDAWVKIPPGQAVWLMASVCAFFKRTVSHPALVAECAAGLDVDAFIQLAARVGLSLEKTAPAAALSADALPAIVLMSSTNTDGGTEPSWAIALAASNGKFTVIFPTEREPQQITEHDFGARVLGIAFQVREAAPRAVDPDEVARQNAPFGFRWFIPELLKHKTIWRDVLLASVAIQLMALAFPLFTQAIIDKVVVHHTQSTLVAIVVGMIIFTGFAAALTWIRQYLVLHTGNRVDAVLGSHVFEHLLRLPLAYFQHRPTGVVAARLNGIEIIREFVSSAAVTLVLDLPLVCIFAGVMLFYSVPLTLIVLAILALITVASILAAPIFQGRLNEQFQRGAANQAFITEYVAAMETVKSLQLEPQLNAQYRDRLAAYLSASVRTRQLANSYSTVANTLEQLMSLLVLAVGAYIVMTSAALTVGMLIAFQMFASRISQPVLRMVSLWQQFQQARLSVKRLGDLMDAPAEPYRLQQSRSRSNACTLSIEDLSFRYNDNAPYLYQGFNFTASAGELVVVMGASGVGKSTLAKLMQSFYPPTSGAIRLDNTDIRYLAANELRSYFGVVPQETTLFSGSILDNLRLANPYATFEQVIAACKMAEIHTTIEALPNGYETGIGERGVGLSGGQRQRIAIARALLKGPRVLLFDEATSSLDATTAEQLGRTINALKGKATIVFIAHAVPKTLQPDRIVRIGEKLSIVNREPSEEAVSV
jgi:ATP-binding cassette, subfamily B, bacterial HlyB/CyaB